MIWRTNIFIFLSAMTMTMQYYDHQVPVTRLMKNLVPLLPLYYLSLAMHTPVTMGCGSAGLFNFIVALVIGQSIIIGNPMAHAWTLSAIVLFTLFFNKFLKCFKAGCCCCCGCERHPCCADATPHPFAVQVPPNGLPGTMLHVTAPSDTTITLVIPDGVAPGQTFMAVEPSAPNGGTLPPRTFGVFMTRLALWSIGAHVASLTWIVSHFFFWLQIPRFLLGMAVGEGVLHVKMDDKTEKFCGRLTDAIVAVFAILSFAFPWSWDTNGGFLHNYLMYAIHNWPMAFVLFGLCRSKYSYTAKFMSLELFTGFTRYTYAAYMLHFPILAWGQYARVHGFDSWADIFNHKYGAASCTNLEEEWKSYCHASLQAQTNTSDASECDDLREGNGNVCVGHHDECFPKDFLDVADWTNPPWPFYINVSMNLRYFN